MGAEHDSERSDRLLLHLCLSHFQAEGDHGDGNRSGDGCERTRGVGVGRGDGCTAGPPPPRTAAPASGHSRRARRRGAAASASPSARRRLAAAPPLPERGLGTGSHGRQHSQRPGCGVSGNSRETGPQSAWDTRHTGAVSAASPLSTRAPHELCSGAQVPRRRVPQQRPGAPSSPRWLAFSSSHAEEQNLKRLALRSVPPTGAGTQARAHVPARRRRCAALLCAAPRSAHTRLRARRALRGETRRRRAGQPRAARTDARVPPTPGRDGSNTRSGAPARPGGR